MSWLHGLTGLVCLGLLVYLAWALLKAEDF